jgi:hypothetical protein
VKCVARVPFLAVWSGDLVAHIHQRTVPVWMMARRWDLNASSSDDEDEDDPSPSHGCTMLAAAAAALAADAELPVEAECAASTATSAGTGSNIGSRADLLGAAHSWLHDHPEWMADPLVKRATRPIVRYSDRTSKGRKAKAAKHGKAKAPTVRESASPLVPRP